MCFVVRIVLMTFIGGSLLVGCGGEPASLTAPDRRTDPFTIVLGLHPAEPDVPPALDGDTLHVRVEYSGGCRDHAFALESTTRGDTTLLSLRHDAGGDGCEALVYDELRLALPEPIEAAGPVLLRNPQGGVPFRLR